MKLFLPLRMLVADLENSKLHIKYRKRHTINLTCRNSQIIVLISTFTPAQCIEISGCLINWNFLASTYPAGSPNYPHCRKYRSEHLALHLHRVKCLVTSYKSGWHSPAWPKKKTATWLQKYKILKSFKCCNQAEHKYRGNKSF